MKQYIEIVEEFDLDSQVVPQMMRVNVTSDAEAEQIYSDNKNKFGNHSAKLVEENHGATAKENKPCKAFKIKDGKVVR